VIRIRDIVHSFPAVARNDADDRPDHHGDARCNVILPKERSWSLRPDSQHIPSIIVRCQEDDRDPAGSGLSSTFTKLQHAEGTSMGQTARTE
jgi:hypothetical protein